jgi:hypothetical protein
MVEMGPGGMLDGHADRECPVDPASTTADERQDPGGTGIVAFAD